MCACVCVCVRVSVCAGSPSCMALRAWLALCWQERRQFLSCAAADCGDEAGGVSEPASGVDGRGDGPGDPGEEDGVEPGEEEREEREEKGEPGRSGRCGSLGGRRVDMLSRLYRGWLWER